MRSGTTLLQQILCASPAANSFIHGCRYLVSQIGVYAQYAGPDRLFIDDYLGGPQGLFDFTKDLLDRMLQKTHQRSGRPAALVLKSPELATYFPHAAVLIPAARFVIRSEAHTSEHQSLMRISYGVLCLKKKKKTQLILHILMDHFIALLCLHKQHRK